MKGSETTEGGLDGVDCVPGRDEESSPETVFASEAQVGSASLRDLDAPELLGVRRVDPDVVAGGEVDVSLSVGGDSVRALHRNAWLELVGVELDGAVATNGKGVDSQILAILVIRDADIEEAFVAREGDPVGIGEGWIIIPVEQDGQFAADGIEDG